MIAESFERIHRSNLVGFGVLPLQFVAGQNSASLGLTGEEIYSLTEPVKTGAKQVELVAKTESGTEIRFSVGVRIDTATEWEYFQNQGILHTVLRKLAQA